MILSYEYKTYFSPLLHEYTSSLFDNRPSCLPDCRLQMPRFTVERTEILLQNTRWIFKLLLLYCR